MVAGGGGGGEWKANGNGNGKIVTQGGDSGGLTGYEGGYGTYPSSSSGTTTSSTGGSKGGTQTAGGTVKGTGLASSPGKFGIGGNGGYGTSPRFFGGGGGGGYYGGAAGGSVSSYRVAGGGGSSFISGMTGCTAIVPSSSATPAADSDATLNYSFSVFGNNTPTWADGADIEFTNCTMLDGKATTMPNLSGGTMTGNAGNGYARITRLE